MKHLYVPFLLSSSLLTKGKNSLKHQIPYTKIWKATNKEMQTLKNIDWRAKLENYIR